MKQIVSIFFLVLLSSLIQAQKVEKKKDLYGIIYEDKWLVKPKFEEITRLSDEGDNVSCFAIKQEGKFDIYYLVKDQALGRSWKELDFPYDEIQLITEQLAKTRLGENFGLIQVDNWKTEPNKPSKEVIQPNCSAIELWSKRANDNKARDHNAVWFQINGKEGLALNVGSKTAPKYRLVVTGADAMQVFESNQELLAVEMNAKVGLFDVYKNQKYIFPPKYESIKHIDIDGFESPEDKGGYFLVEEYGKYGLSYIDLQEELMLLELQYDSIIQIGRTGFFKLIKENKEGLSNLLTGEKSLKELCRVGYDSLKLVNFSQEEAGEEFFIALQFDGLKGFARVLPQNGGEFELLSIPEFDEIHSFRKAANGALSYVVGKSGAYGYRYFVSNDEKWDVDVQYREIISLEHEGDELFFCIKNNTLDINPHQKRSTLFLSRYKELQHPALVYHRSQNDLVTEYFRIDYYNHQTKSLKALQNYRIKAGDKQFSIAIGIPDSVLACCLESREVFLQLGNKSIDVKKLFVELPFGPRFKNNMLSYDEDGALRINEWLESEKKISLASYYYKSDTLMSKTFGAIVDSYTYEDKKQIRKRKELSGDKKKELEVSLHYGDSMELLSVVESFNAKEERSYSFEYDSSGLSGIQVYMKNADSRHELGAGLWKFERDSSGTTTKVIYIDNSGQKKTSDISKLPRMEYHLKRDELARIKSIECKDKDGNPCTEASEYHIIRDKNGRFESLEIKDAEGGKSRRTSDVHLIEALQIGNFILPETIKADHF